MRRGIVVLACLLLEAGVGLLFPEPAHGPAQGPGPAVHDARGDEGVHGRQVNGPEPDYDWSAVVQRFIACGGRPPAVGDPVAQATSAGRPSLALRAELGPSDHARQPGAQHAERRGVGSHEPVHRPRVGLAAFGPARPVEEGPHRGLPEFYLRIVAVLQHLDPRDRAVGGRPA